MAGQVETQPTETVESLSGLAAAIGGSEELETEQPEAQGEEVEAEEVEQGEAPDEPEESEPESDEPVFTIKHDGKDIALKQSELLEMAQKGFDYTNKTMSLAEERKALEPERQAVKQKLAEYDGRIQETLRIHQAAAEVLESEIGEPPTIELAQYDAASYIAKKEAYEAKVAKLRNTYGQIQVLEQQQNHLRQSELLAQANETEKYLVEKLPGWKDAPEKSLQELNSYILEYGLSPETAREAYVQKGLWELAHKAREFDKLMSQKAALKPKADLPKVVKPTAGNQPNIIQKQEKLKQFDRKSRKGLGDLASILG